MDGEVEKELFVRKVVKGKKGIMKALREYLEKTDIPFLEEFCYLVGVTEEEVVEVGEEVFGVISLMRSKRTARIYRGVLEGEYDKGSLATVVKLFLEEGVECRRDGTSIVGGGVGRVIEAVREVCR